MGRAGEAIFLGLITALAFALRIHHLGDQILGGDEVHLLRVISRESVGTTSDVNPST